MQSRNFKHPNRIPNSAGRDTSMISITFVTVAFLRERTILKTRIRNTMISMRERLSNIEPQKIISISPSNMIYKQGTLAGDRVLDARDIDGAIPGSMQSKAVRNQEKAQRMRQERDLLKAQNVKALYLSQVEEPEQSRAKSYSIQETPYEPIKYETPKYDYMNKPLKLPVFGERETPVINPISNKLQLRQNHKNYLSEDYDKTIQMLQQPMRLYV